LHEAKIRTSAIREGGGGEIEYHIYGTSIPADDMTNELTLKFENMEHKESGRHLAAILFTDIVAYTAMMQRDEALALSAVRRHQEVLERIVPLHEGEVHQYYGDGSLNIFHSAIQAVKAALEIQKELLMDPPVLLKIGLHIGEIYTENGKIFGDGVNIASRIESIGQGGTGIIIQGCV
jgi:class 3 adenylate cyclase